LCLLWSLPPDSRAQDQSSQFILYLEKTRQVDPGASLRLEGITLLGESVTTAVVPAVRDVSAADLARRQVLLAEASVEPGTYLELRLALWLASPAGPSDSMAAPRALEARIPLGRGFEAGRAEVVFLRWQRLPSAEDSAGWFREIFKRKPPETALAWVSHDESGWLALVDRGAGEVVGGIYLGGSLRGMAWSPRARLLFVADAAHDAVIAVDAASRQVRQVIHLNPGDEPEALCLSPDETRLFAANPGSHTVAVMDLYRLAVEARVSVGRAPVDLAADPAGRLVYVVNSLSDDVSILDPGRLAVIQTVMVGSRPRAIEMDSRRRTAYVANQLSGDVSVINLDRLAVTATLRVEPSVSDLAVQPFSGQLYAALPDQDLVAVCRPEVNAVLANLPAAGAPVRAALDLEGGFLYVTCRDSGLVRVMDPAAGRTERAIAVGSRPYMTLIP
jgi:YVTN family beta-propeller protein